jgi:hypothetical protein
LAGNCLCIYANTPDLPGHEAPDIISGIKY